MSDERWCVLWDLLHAEFGAELRAGDPRVAGMVKAAGVMALAPEFRIFGLMRGRGVGTKEDALKEARQIELLDSLRRVGVGQGPGPTAGDLLDGFIADAFVGGILVPGPRHPTDSQAWGELRTTLVIRTGLSAASELASDSRAYPQNRPAPRSLEVFAAAIKTCPPLRLPPMLTAGARTGRGDDALKGLVRRAHGTGAYRISVPSERVAEVREAWAARLLSAVRRAHVVGAPRPEGTPDQDRLAIFPAGPHFAIPGANLGLPDPAQWTDWYVTPSGAVTPPVFAGPSRTGPDMVKIETGAWNAEIELPPALDDETARARLLEAADWCAQHEYVSDLPRGER